MRLINKISSVVKLRRIDWFFGFILWQDSMRAKLRTLHSNSLLNISNMVELVRFHGLPLSCSNKIARIKPLCVCNWLRCPSRELLGRRTGACRTARQWVNESMSSGARALTQCGKKRMQMHREPTPIWMSMTPVCFWNLWLVDIFGKNAQLAS